MARVTEQGLSTEKLELDLCSPETRFHKSCIAKAVSLQTLVKQARRFENIASICLIWFAMTVNAILHSLHKGVMLGAIGAWKLCRISSWDLPRSMASAEPSTSFCSMKAVDRFHHIERPVDRFTELFLLREIQLPLANRKLICSTGSCW